MSQPVSLTWDAVISPFDLVKGTVKVFTIAGLFVWFILETMSRFSSGSFSRAIMESIAKGYSDVYYAGGFVGFWLLLSFLACWLLFRKGYPVSFTVGPDGVVMTTQPRQRKINRIINNTLFWLSLFSGRPGGMGTALLAEAGQSSAYSWTDISKVSCQPKRRTILLKNNWRTVMVLYATPDNYHVLAELVQTYYNQYASERKYLAETAPGWGKTIARLLVYPAFLLAATLVWHSPLLTHPHGAIVLALAACIAWASHGTMHRYSTGVLVATLLGLIIAMSLGAFEPQGDGVLFRYYRYSRLDRMPYLAEFIGSILGLLAFGITAWACVKKNQAR